MAAENRILRRYDMNGRSLMQGGKNWNFAERDKCKPVLPRLSWAENLEKPPCPSMGGTERNGGSVAIDSVRQNVPYPVQPLCYRDELVKPVPETTVEITCINCSRPSDPF